jgi:hypothetical protein
MTSISGCVAVLPRPLVPCTESTLPSPYRVLPSPVKSLKSLHIEGVYRVPPITPLRPVGAP